jgi:hypothetical protein
LWIETIKRQHQLREHLCREVGCDIPTPDSTNQEPENRPLIATIEDTKRLVIIASTYE